MLSLMRGLGYNTLELTERFPLLADFYFKHPQAASTIKDVERTLKQGFRLTKAQRAAKFTILETLKELGLIKPPIPSPPTT